MLCRDRYMIGQNVTETVESLITAQAAELTPAERKLTAELMRDYPVSGLRSVTKLADDAGVSTPTVIRLARKLGFEGFPEMQAALRSEASGRLNSGAIDDSGWTVASRVSPTFEAFTSAIYRNLARTIERLDPATFAEIADVLGLTIETVSRKLGSLEKAGAIRRNGKRGIELVDPALLSEAAL